MSSVVSSSRRIRRWNTGLAATCIALGTALALVMSLVISGGIGPSTDPPPATSVGVFAEGDAPSEVSSTAVETVGFPAALSSAVLSDGVSVFSDSTTPAHPVDPDGKAVELGMRFTPKIDGTVTAIRFYKTDSNIGPHVGTLWSEDGRILARATFPAATAPGWHTVQLSPAVAVTAGTGYVVSYLAPNGRYSGDQHYFDRGLSNDYITVPAGAGVYTYEPGAFPTQNYLNCNYYVDVVMAPGGPTPEPTPSPTPTPAPTPTPTPTQTPSPAPSPTPTPAAPQSGVFGDGVTPNSPVDPDRASVELGMKFTPKVSGQVTALRFYKTEGNVGPHVGTLWDARGTVLARATFDTESASGWQTAVLSRPIAVAAGAQYVVSYLAPQGRYASDQHYFDRGVETTYLSVPVGGGVYAYGSGSYPTQTYLNSNYYVDIRFSPGIVTQPTPSPTPTATSTPTPTPTVSPTPTPTPTATATPTPTATPTSTPTTPAPGSGELNLPTEPWWGGPAYYSRFPKANASGWDEDTFFPIAVFLGKPAHAASLAALGVNTYMGAEHDGSAVSAITSQGISVLAQSEWSSQEVGTNPLVVGWHVSDECDMGLGGCDSPQGETGSLAIQKQYVADARAKNDGRFVQANFGNGVLGTYWSTTTMDDHLALVDVASVDKYAYTSPHVQDLFRSSPYWPAGKNPASAAAYGWQQDRMESFMSPAASKPNWVFVETSRPFLIEPGATTITVPQIRGAVWNGIIHGAAGIAYFQHNNDGCGTYSLVDCSASLRDGVRALNAEVKSLAPVINSPSYKWSFGSGLDTALKSHEGYAYIFAMTDGGTGSRQFTLPAGLTGTVEVIGEGRTITATGGVFTDQFAAESTHHIYRIALR